MDSVDGTVGNGCGPNGNGTVGNGAVGAFSGWIRDASDTGKGYEGG